jgi:hypothetical protein
MAFVVVVVAFVIVTLVFVVVACRSFSRVGLKVAFDGIRRTQRFAFQAPMAPFQLPLLAVLRKLAATRIQPAFLSNKRPPHWAAAQCGKQLRVAGEYLISW